MNKVTGNECLNYINRPIGFGSHDLQGLGQYDPSELLSAYASVIRGRIDNRMHIEGFTYSTLLQKWVHNVNKRKIGLILDRADDGGYYVALLGDEPIRSGGATVGDEPVMAYAGNIMRMSGIFNYFNNSMEQEYQLESGQFSSFPRYPNDNDGGVTCELLAQGSYYTYDFDEAVDFAPGAHWYIPTASAYFGSVWDVNGVQYTGTGSFQLTDDKTTTLCFGHIFYFPDPDILRYPKDFTDDPLKFLGGALYDHMASMSIDIQNAVMTSVPYGTPFDTVKTYPRFLTGLESSNLTSVPYNLILTHSEQYAKAYLDNGTLPPDAFLFPLDFNDLPGYNSDDPSDDDDADDGDDPDNDDTRNIIPDELEVPSYLPQNMSNNNYYWLTLPQLESFIEWFWNDIGDLSDFDDLINKIMGLYNDLGATILMIRYFPVDVSWIGGLGNDDNIILGMIEKAGAVNTISKTGKPIIRTIGNITIDRVYNSFCDLSPLSQLSVYLPFHGLVDLDVDIYMGHDLTVKAVYDFTTGTIQYFLLCDGDMLTNTFICKMAVDIPITLQSKSDRDSAIFSNVASSVAGLIGAGTSLATGNPIGLVAGANALNAGAHSASLNVKGTIGEQGAFYAPSKCKIIVRRPTLAKPTNYNSIVGKCCGKAYRLSDIKGSGYTEIYNPRLKFTKTAPLQEEVKEIYDLLESGVIL